MEKSNFLETWIVVVGMLVWIGVVSGLTIFVIESRIEDKKNFHLQVAAIILAFLLYSGGIALGVYETFH